MRRPGLPLPLLTGLVAVACVGAVSGATAAVLVRQGGLDRPAVEALAAGTAVGLVLAAAAVVAGLRVSRLLRRLRDDALLRLREPAAPLAVAERPVLVSTELAELARALDGLHQRVRLADELGERSRREAETASAGVFELLSGLVAAEEGARGQLAAELHDTVAQSLMIAHGLLALPEPDLVRLADYVEDAEEQVRAVMARTRPPALRDGDLASAVSGLQADVRARYGLAVAVSWPATPSPLPASSAVIVYRFFQEALLNVVKHADVDDAALVLEVTEDALLATVADDGPGFDPQAVRPDRGRHVGLGLLRERARLAGGAVTVDSSPGAGTRLALRLPLPTRAVRGVPAQVVPERQAVRQA